MNQSVVISVLNGDYTREYLEKKETIHKEILEMKSNVNEMTAALQNLNKQFLQDELSRRNQSC
ncbi:hypothetical protein ACT7DL_32600 [Bacillus paranthracis]